MGTQSTLLPDIKVNSAVDFLSVPEFRASMRILKDISPTSNLTNAHIHLLTDFIKHGKSLVLTGAGISTGK